MACILVIDLGILPSLSPDGFSQIAWIKAWGGVKNMQDTGEYLEFLGSYTFKTPSGAAVAVYSGNANGWKHWKTKGEKTLDEVKREPDKGN